MSKFDATDDEFEQIDTNRDGRIDKNEFRTFGSNTEGLPSSSYGSSTGRFNLNDNTTSRFDRDKYKFSDLNASGYTTDKYASYGATTGARDLIDDTVINTNSLEETDAYLARSANNIYRDPNPQIIRRATADRPVTYEQRVVIKYLQPPPVPEPGPLIIREMRPPQPPLPGPIVIRQHASRVPSPPPLILRERPPTPPPSIPSETVTRCLPALPLPPRPVVIERFPPLPPKPRDIIIERWIPYGSRGERRTKVVPAPPPTPYPEPRNTTIIYETVETRTARKFEKLGVIRENPTDYVNRHGGSLLDSATLVQQARNAGVTEDISPPAPSSSIYTSVRGNTNFDQSDDMINRGFSPSGGCRCGCEGSQLTAGTQAIDRGNTNYASLGSNFIRESESECGFYGGDANLTATDANRNKQLKYTEF
ncbi:unnamed protein product [Rotaria sordida]|uniref:EF-hand domain-containing protein n=1 Tax=Rotaria sordida TaxID=392033 RepID=A0A815H3F9_9BILA|nr:unnamed protein product [Rotaria sordida]CAF1346273.1 unnamed protein product [Rotaria sordida]